MKKHDSKPVCHRFKILLCWSVLAATCLAREYHVAVNGENAGDGGGSHPLRSIQEAANRAVPGDVVTVHEGVYRERIDPPRGGESDAKRIVYQAAPGEKAAIKGSGIVKGWKRLENDTWRVILPNSYFGEFNPYADEIHGDWFKPMGRKHHTGAIYVNGHWLTEAATLEEVLKPAGGNPLWFASVDDMNTTISAQYPGVDPNLEDIEINVRKTVFYPSITGCDFITVRGFTLEHAATNWAPPTAEQVGLIGTHWSKEWIIEDNTIRYSVCSGISLGKHGDRFDNTSQNSAEGYVETIKRGLAAGWSKERIGHHVVRNNRISHCEQAGIVGSLGAAFSVISGNEIHDIHVRWLFGGAEQAGIKFHGAIDTVIRNNHIYRANRGIWLDWMAQGTRVTCNFIHDITPQEDLYVEVNHGPFLIDHNLFLSEKSLADWSEGGAYAHNLFAGKIVSRPELRRETPWQEEHGTRIAGLTHVKGGDNRFFNNVFIAPAGLDGYDNSTRPNQMAGNVFLKGARPCRQEKSPLVLPDFDPGWSLRETKDDWHLEWDAAWPENISCPWVDSELLGKTAVGKMRFVNPDDSSCRLDHDCFGVKRSGTYPAPGPFGTRSSGKQSILIQPKSPSR